MDAHLGRDRHERGGNGNARNGKRTKTLITDVGPVSLDVPRDRDGTFTPQIVAKRQRRFGGVDNLVISLTAKGLTTGEVCAHLAEVYGTEVSKETISTITDRVLDSFGEWQSRPLDPVYPVVFIDCIHVKIRDGQVANRPIYVALAVTVDGGRDILGRWAGDSAAGGEGYHILALIGLLPERFRLFRVSLFSRRDTLLGAALRFPVRGGVRRGGGSAGGDRGRLSSRRCWWTLSVPGRCVEAFVTSWTARGSRRRRRNDVGVLERMLDALRRPAWEVARPISTAWSVSWRRRVGRCRPAHYLQVFRGFHRFLQVRKAAEIETAFGVRLVCPVDEFNSARHVGDVSAACCHRRAGARGGFFDFLKVRIGSRASTRRPPVTTRCSAPCITPGCAARRRRVGPAGCPLGRGPFGKLHVRFGKAAKTSGPRPRWVPMLDGLDVLLRWFLPTCGAGSLTPMAVLRRVWRPAAPGTSVTGCGT